MSHIMKRRGMEQTSSSDKNTLTAAMFLGKVGDVTYVNSKTLLQFIDNSRIEDVQELEALFGLVKEQQRITVPRTTRYDKGRLPYKYATFPKPNGLEGAKVVIIGNINQFMVDYRDGKFVTDFTLEDLVAEAEKA